MGTCATTVYVASADRTREMVAGGGVDWDPAADAVRATERAEDVLRGMCGRGAPALFECRE